MLIATERKAPAPRAAERRRIPRPSPGDLRRALAVWEDDGGAIGPAERSSR